MTCRHLFGDGTCRRFPPVATTRGGAVCWEWPKPPQPAGGCVCGERAPKPEKGANPPAEAATRPQRGKRSTPREAR